MQTFERTPLASWEEAKTYIGQYFTASIETLWISDSMHDPVGMTMAIIGDVILKAGYLPAGFEQKDGYRIYTYQKME
jgi:hypothetical protein